MSSSKVFSEPARGSVRPAIAGYPAFAGRPDRMPRTRAIAASGPGVTVIARAPSLALAPFVEWIAYYDLKLSPGWRELVLPTGTMLLVVNLAEREFRWWDGPALATARAGRGALLVGACAGPFVVGGAGRQTVALVSFRPAGSYPFFQAPGSVIGEPAVELEALWGPDGAVLRERLLEAGTPAAALSTLDAVLAARAVRPLAADPALVAAAGMLGRGAAVAKVADRVGWTERTLERRFCEQAGLSPKRFARLRRLQRLLARLPADGEVDWARAAFESGYFDQSHLINEFRALTGLTPGAYRPQPGCRNHHLPAPGTSASG
jgi:AraC-like DNA-binding protein